MVGNSGVGKDTIVDILCKKTGYRKVVTCTTAPRRSDQVDGVHHYFVSKERFREIMGNGHTLAYTKIGDNEYVTALDLLDEKMKFYIIDPKGVEELERDYQDEIDLVKIYIHVPEEIRRQRTSKRGNYDFDKRRLDEEAQFEKFDREKKWDLRVENIDLDKSVDTIMNFLGWDKAE